MKILIVEDDAQIAQYVKRCLLAEGYSVDLATDGIEALASARAAVYDTILLDVNLPARNGFEIAAELRATGDETPILMLTGRDETDDLLHGFDSGADDYVTKPFKLEELLVRIRALCRRASAAKSATISSGPVQLDRLRHEVTVDGRPLNLTRREFILLDLLVQQPGQVLTRAELRAKVCGMEQDSDSNAVDVHVGNVRRKLRDLGYEAVIETARGIGFRFNPAAAPDAPRPEFAGTN